MTTATARRTRPSTGRHRFPHPPPAALLLGPQRVAPTLRAALARLAVDGPLAVISAGWQDEEGELDELRQAGIDATDLALYRRTEAVFADDSALFRAHRARQTRLHDLQRCYQVRLGHAQAALRELATLSDDAGLLATQRRAALAALRLLDRQHLRLIAGAHAEFARDHAPACNGAGALAAQRAELAALIERSAAVLITGGHVGTLCARLRLFELAPLLATRPLVAWSAGAMALTERVVAFHDRIPQRPDEPEIVDTGLGLLGGWVVLPHARARLLLDDTARQSAFATRLAPLRCVALETGSELLFRDGRLVAARAERLNRRGRLVALRED